MNVLVTGGAGFVGSHVVDRLVAEGHAVTVVDDLTSGRRENVNAAATLRECDVRTPELHRVIGDVRPRAVVHLAAQAAVPRSVTEPLFDTSRDSEYAPARPDPRGWFKRSVGIHPGGQRVTTAGHVARGKAGGTGRNT
jgi:uncharacterized protein YbjT (DUF2867 family)